MKETSWKASIIYIVIELEFSHPMEEMTEIIEINQEELECEMCNGQSLEEIITIIRVCMKCRRRSLMEKPKCIYKSN